ncbi:obscurin isoform X3 [Rhodnius prolixus]
MSEETEGYGKVFTVSQDYEADDSSTVSVHRGEKVLLLDTKTKDPSKDTLIDRMDIDVNVEIKELLDNSAARHKIAIKPKRNYPEKQRWSVQSLEDPNKQGLLPIVALTPHEQSPPSGNTQDIIFRKEAVISELVETEEEFCRDVMQVVDRYLRPLDGSSVPRFVSDKKDLLFGNFKEIAVFHNTVLLEGIKYYSKEPKSLGRAFLRMERDFDKHVAYCHDEPAAQDFLQQNENVRVFFEDLASKLRDDKNLGEHLKLPIQRINDYQLLLKELVKYCEKLGEDTTDLCRALELMLGIPHRAEDLKFITNIEGYHGDIHKLGRLLRHNWFKVKSKDGKLRERYLFLFKARILVCKVRKIAEDRYVFVLKEIIRLPEVEAKDHRNDKRSFEVGPFTLVSHEDNVKEPWLAEIRHYARNALTLAEHEADDLRLQEEENKKLEPLKGVELKFTGDTLSNSDEEMDKASRKTTVTKKVEEIRKGSITESNDSVQVIQETIIKQEKIFEEIFEEQIEEQFDEIANIEEIHEEIQEEFNKIIEPVIMKIEEPPEDTAPRCEISNTPFSRTIKGLNLEPGGSAAFECEIDCSKVIWLKDNKPISDEILDRITQMSVGNVHRLEIINVKESDAGVYTAHATGPNGEISTCSTNLVVHTLTDEERRQRNAPLFLVKLKNTELLQHTYLRFMVKVKGEPAPTVNFYKDGQLITYRNEHVAIISDQAANGYYELIIPEVKNSDAGTYKCVATNSYGEVSCDGLLTIVDDKKIFEGLTDGKKSNEPEFQWIKDGQPFDPEERFKVLFQDEEDSLALVFTHVKPEDAGLYTCVASTNTGKISCSAELTVQGNVNLLFREPEPPKIEKKHEFVDTNIGSSAMLETKVTGYPKPEIKWFKNGQELPMGDKYKILYEDDETLALVVKNISLEDIGSYTVVASNVSGKASEEITLDVKAAPSFTKKLMDVHAISGQEIRLNVQIDANPKPMVAWYKDGKQILDSEHIKLIEEGNSYTLLIQNSQLSDVGSYSIVCKNNISQCSEFCKVDIEGAPIFTRNLIKKVETEEGDSLTFLVKVHGNPMPSVQWFYKGKPVPSDARKKITSDHDTHSLTINAINREDAGEYSCKLLNVHGTNTDHGRLYVKTAPQFAKGMGHVMAQEGDTNVGFTVEIDSFPKGKVRWFHNETELKEDKDYTVREVDDSYTLVIKEVSRTSAGKYRCVIENQYGSNESSADLTVLCKPVFCKPLSEMMKVNEGETLSLKIEVDGTPQPQVKWYKDGEEVHEDAHIKISRDSHRVENYELTVNLVKAEDSGEYEVRAKNENGTAVTKTTVIVQTRSSTGTLENTSVATITQKQSEEEQNVASLGSLEHKEDLFIIDTADHCKDDQIRHEVSQGHLQGNALVQMENEINETMDEIKENGYIKCIEIRTKGQQQYMTDSDTQQHIEMIGIHKEMHMIAITSSLEENQDTEVSKMTLEMGKLDNGESDIAKKMSITDDATMKNSLIPTEKEEEIQKPKDVSIDDGKTLLKPFSSAEKQEETQRAKDISIKVREPTLKPEKNEITPKPADVSIKDGEISLEPLLSVKETEETHKSIDLSVMDGELPSKLSISAKKDEDIQKLIDVYVKDVESPLKFSTSAEKDEEIPKVEDVTLKDDEFPLETLMSIDKDEETLKPENTSIKDSESPVRSLISVEKDDKIQNPKDNSIKDGESSLKRLICVEREEETQKPAYVSIKDDESPLEHLISAVKDEEIQKLNDIIKDGESPLKPLSFAENEEETQKYADVSLTDSETLSANKEQETQKSLDIKDIETPSAVLISAEKAIRTMENPNASSIDDLETCIGSKLFDKLDETNLSDGKLEASHFGQYGLVEQNQKTHSKISNLEQNTENNASPTITKSYMKDIDVFETWEHTFEIEAVGTPKPTAKWLKDGKEIKGSERFIAREEGEVKYKFEVVDCQLTDTGEYRVVLSNNLGEATESAKLKIIDAKDFRLPQIQKPLVAQAVPKNNTAVLKVVLTADPIPEVEWQVNGSDVPTEMIADSDSKLIHHGLKECIFTLTIPSCKHENTGEYKFKAVNKSGEAECAARLDVQLKPEILVFKDITGIPYEDSTFVAVVHSNPRATISWRRDGKKLSQSDHFDITTDDVNEVYKLKIIGILLDDAGSYTLSAVNEVGESSADAKLKIHMEEPEFTKKLDDVMVREYAELDLKVRAQGVPKPELTWSKDGIELEISEGMTLDTRCEGSVSSHLNIPHFKEEYSGKYKVRAYSVAGHADTQCYVKLAMLAPMFSKTLGRAQEVEQGDPLELRCKVEASPSATVKWFKDGEELKASDHVQLINHPDGSIKLRIDKVTPADCGAYKVLVENSLGTDSSICAVAVNPSPTAPVILKKLCDVTTTEGEPMFLEAQVMGFPLPELKWFKDGLPVRTSRAVNFINSPGGLVGLSVDKTLNEHAGSYTLTAVNKLGEASSSAKVEIILKDRRPEFQTHLVPQTVVEGFPVRLTIKANGNPKPEITWQHDGSTIDIDGEHIKSVELPDGVQYLLFDKATPLDAGTYSAIISNNAGVVTSEARLDVVDQARDDMPIEPPSFAHPMRDAWAEEGSIIGLSVPFKGNPVPKVSWFKGDVELQPDHRISFTNDGYKVGIQFSPCDMNDIGSYKCKLTNNLGSAESSAKVSVKKIYHAPMFVQKLHDLDQIIGLDGKLVCRVSGNPRPDISWFQNGHPIYEGNRFHMKREGDSCILYIKDCTPDEDGYYKCIASNRDGKDETQCQFMAVDKITTKEKGEAPCFLKKIGDQEVINGITGRFTACISGYPEPEVEWYRNNERLYPSERIKMERETTGLLRLTVAHIDPDVDVAKYKLRIYNDHGEDECTASFIYDTMGLGDRRPVGEQYKDFSEFKHTGTPMPLADRPLISRMSDRRLTLSWKPSIPYGPRDPVTYQVEMCELPNGDWFTARSGIRSCACEIRNLESFRDYKFRVRVENKYGVSDPSPYAVTYRAKLEPEPPRFIPFLAPGIDFRPESSYYFPKDFDIERPPHDGYAQAPRFLRQEHYTQYGVKGHNCNLFWFVYGYPKPKMSHFFNDHPIDMGGRYDSSYTRNGHATLFINKMLDRDVGTYEAVAQNEHGEARQRVHLEIAEFPEFIRRPEELTLIARHTGRLEARVIGVPTPDIKWYKDWQPLAPSSRIKISRIDPDHCNLMISDAITKDSGLYSITASNVAGAISCSVMVHVEETDEHPFHHYGRGHGIKPKTKPLSDLYDLGDELGRGTQGVTYHAVERISGRNYAAKIMHGRGELKSFMNNELDIMNILNSHKIIRIHDSFETLDSITLIMELASGGELLDSLTRQSYTTESEIACYIRQLLVALDYMHEQNIAHLGLTPGDLLISHPGGDDLKLCDFGQSRRIHPGQLQPLEYGMPEFVSPETIRGEGVDMMSDMWSVGVITYLLLTGVSLFRGNNDMETLMKVKEGFWEFDEEYWSNITVEARDFITKLLVIEPYSRLDVKAALRHPWLNLADRLPPNQWTIPTERLHNYYNLWKDWYSNASCRTWYRRRPLIGAFSHPSKMVYPPHYIATPLPSPERETTSSKDKKPSWIDQLPSRQPLNYDVGIISSESHYQNGPDTYLLQLRDVDFPVRIREYMKVAAHRGSPICKFSEENHLDWKLPVIRERRRFTDVMDEEIDDERKARISQYGLGDSYTVRRLKHELGSRLDTHVEAEALIEATRQGQAPFMREKPQITPIEDGKPVQLVCYAVGDPQPTIQWFKNDMMIGGSNRIKIFEDKKGRSYLRLEPANAVDAGIYKVVARNRVGQTVSRTRLVLATVPDAPDSPTVAEISDRQVLLKWKQPKRDGNSPIVCYSLQYQMAESSEWKEVNNKITHEFYLVKNLRPATGYLFRLASWNAIGWSEPGIATEIMRTLEEGCNPIQLSNAMKHLQSISESLDSIEELIQEHKEELDYGVEKAPVQWQKQQPTDKYNFISEISRGRFSVAVKAIDKTCDKDVVAKILDASPNTKYKVDQEFEALCSLRHERIAALIEAFLPYDAGFCVFILEKLQGADIITYLSSRHEYTEHMVATIISQVLDGLQYLHWRGLCHLDLQPDNIVMASLKSLQVKLVDLGCAQRVTKLGNVVKYHGHVEFTAPEVLCQEPAYPQSDIWSVGVLAYVMLSGVSPFLGENIGETRQNINFVRFRFEHLYKELTQEATRFLMLVFKRAPNKRPSAEESHEHRWLLPSEYMIKRRERAVFLGSRLKEFSEKYHKTRLEEASTLEALTCLATGKGPLQRSNSIQEELVNRE